VNSDTHSSPVPDASATGGIDDDAVKWHLALRDSQGTAEHAALQRQFRQWLEDASHRAAYEACMRDWARLDPLRDHFRAAPAASVRAAAVRPRRRVRLLGAAAAFAMALAAAGLAWQMHAYADFALLGARQFETPLQKQAALAMRDGTRVDMDVGTTLRVAYSGQRREVTLESGVAFFDVARDMQRPFVIHTGAGEVSVLGTAFVVQRLPDGLRVDVARGHVRVTPAGRAEAVDLTQGQSVRLRHRQFDGVRPIDSRQVAAWREGRLVFDRDTLGDVGEAISRRGVWTVHVDDSVRQLPVTLAVQLDDVANALQSLSDILPVAVARSGRVLTISARAQAAVGQGPGQIDPQSSVSRARGNR